METTHNIFSLDRKCPTPCVRIAPEKGQKYDDRANGIGSGKRSRLPVGEPAAASLESSELVVRADAAGGGRCLRPAADAAAATGADLVSALTGGLATP